MDWLRRTGRLHLSFAPRLSLIKAETRPEDLMRPSTVGEAMLGQFSNEVKGTWHSRYDSVIVLLVLGSLLWKP